MGRADVQTLTFSSSDLALKPMIWFGKSMMEGAEHDIPLCIQNAGEYKTWIGIEFWAEAARKWNDC